VSRRELRDEAPQEAVAERERPRPLAQGPPHVAVLALQAAAGNAATARLLQRQVSTPEEEPVASTEGVPNEAAAALAPEDQRKLGYARSILARVEPLTAGDEVALRKLIPGTLVLQLIQQRDDAREQLERLVAQQDAQLGKGQPVNRHYGPTDPVGDPDVLGGSPFVGASISGAIDDMRKRVEEFDRAIKESCQTLGIADEKELAELVDERFPALFLARAKTIALKMLDENERLVEAEAGRMGVDTGLFWGTDEEAYGGVPNDAAERETLAGVRSAAQELHTLEIEREEVAQARFAVNEENKRLADEEGMDWRVDNGFWAPPLSPKTAEAEAEQTRLESEFKQRRNELGLRYPVLFRIQDYSSIALASDDQLRATTGSKLRELLENIQETRENIESGDLKVWNLNEVFETTMQDLGITPDSPLYASVQERVREEERDESILNIAIAAIGIAAAIVAALPSAGTSLVVAGTAIAAASGVYQLSKSVGSFLAESAASDISLDPVLADISRNSPDLKAVALDLAGLGLDATGLGRVVKMLAGPIRAARVTGDLALLAREVRAIQGLGEHGVATVMAAVSREAEIQAGIVRVVRTIGTRLHPVDMADVVADLTRYDQKLIADALKSLLDAGRVRVLSRAGMAEAYKASPERMRDLIRAGFLKADGFLDKTHGVLFLKPSTFESLEAAAMHEIVHFLQDLHRPLMSRFHQEFEAYAAQRHYLQQLARSGVDPDMAFPTWRWLLDASNDDIVAHLRRNKLYRLTPDPGLDLDDAVLDAIASLNRSERVGATAAPAAKQAATK
jgi:hypothetical protein